MLPEQSNIATRSLGSIRLYADDARVLIRQLTKDFTTKRAVVTYHENGNEKSVFSEDFEAVLDSLPELKYLKMSIQEPEMYGINRLAMIELAAWGENIIRVQSVQEAWAIGKAEALSRQVVGFQRKLATQFRKFGLTVNIVLQLLTLAALPGLDGFRRRLAFVATMVAVQTAITFIHQKYIPNFILFPSKQKVTIIGRLGPGLISWIITIAGAVIGAIIYGLLKGELGSSPLMKAVNQLL